MAPGLQGPQVHPRRTSWQPCTLIQWPPGGARLRSSKPTRGISPDGRVGSRRPRTLVPASATFPAVPSMPARRRSLRACVPAGRSPRRGVAGRATEARRSRSPPTPAGTPGSRGSTTPQTPAFPSPIRRNAPASGLPDRLPQVPSECIAVLASGYRLGWDQEVAPPCHFSAKQRQRRTHLQMYERRATPRPECHLGFLREGSLR
jgi:hypothetical protein